MKWLFIVLSSLSCPVLAVYQPTESELQLLQKNRDGIEKNLKNALPLQQKVDICIGYIKSIGSYKGNNPEVIQYWGRVKHYVDLSIKNSSGHYPRLYYYDKELYAKYGKYPKESADLIKLFDLALDDNYLKAKDYIAISAKYSESLRKKDLNKVCVESVTKKMQAQLFPATASMDKLFYPGITSDNTGEKFNEYRIQMYEHMQFTQLLNKIQASYY